MRRLLIFTALYPPLALAVFTAPDGLQELPRLVGLCLPSRNYPRVVDGGDELEAFRKANLSSDCGDDFCGSGDNRINRFFLVGWVQGVLSSPHGYACWCNSSRSVFVAVE